ncbi:unnamed protein product, partial [Arabidopsis halleri]
MICHMFVVCLEMNPRVLLRKFGIRKRIVTNARAKVEVNFVMISIMAFEEEFTNVQLSSAFGILGLRSFLRRAKCRVPSLERFDCPEVGLGTSDCFPLSRLGSFFLIPCRSLRVLEELRERDAYTEAARKSCEAAFAMNRMVHLYEHRVRCLSTENPNSSDYQAAIAAEKEKVELVARELGVIKGEAAKLREK